jgi:hypothetical protein
MSAPLEAFDALRNHALGRVAQRLPVRWYSREAGACWAEPRDDKYKGAWLVHGDHWEQYYPRADVECQLHEATMFPAVHP